MSLGRISTFALHQTTLRDSSKVQVNLADLQQQLSSGFKSQDFAGLGGSESEQFLLLENKIAKTDIYLNNNKIATTRINSTDNVLSQVIDTAANLKSLISQRRNAASNSGAFPETLKGAWQSLVSQLNTSLEGRFLFGGTRTDVAPVNPDTFPTLEVDGVPDDNYYQGSAEDVLLRADDNTEINYNVRADDMGIQQIFAGLAMAQKGHDANSDADLVKAYDLVTQGLDGVIATRSIVNQNKVAIDNINTRHDSFKLYFQGVKEEIGNADLVSVSTQVAINQGILQAAFQAFAKINSLKLSDFLR
jgi:flagellar hook-associated protein 3 FlgL